METVKGTEIEKAISEAYKSSVLIAGTSAGAAVMSKMMITGNELKHPPVFLGQNRKVRFRGLRADLGSIWVSQGPNLVILVYVCQEKKELQRPDQCSGD
jgi:cyanophycinase-like exopeptidase